jgi:holin-like protein
MARPVPVTIAVVLIYLGALLGAAIGVLVLLSRYQAEADQVLPVSLIGAGIILFGLLMLAVGGGVGRGSRGSRLIVTIYLAVQVVLHSVTIASTESWDWFGFAQVVFDVLILAALWLPPGSRYFRAASPTDAEIPAPA